MNKKIFILVIIIFNTLISCQGSDNISDTEAKEAKPIILPLYANDVLTSNNNFGIALFADIANQEQKNIMLSPLSANIALCMLLNGANKNTFNQIKEMLGYENLTLSEINNLYNTLTMQLLEADEKVTLNLANALFYNDKLPVKNTYKTTIETAYQAKIEGLDFGNSTNTIDRINNWASNSTHGKVIKVMDAISPDAVAFLLNAVYFKGDWTQKFMKEQTQNLNFTLNDGNTINIPTMSGEIPVKAYFGNDFSTYELSYGHNNFVMDITLPTKTLPEFLIGFNSNLYSTITDGLDQQTNPVNYMIRLPKFKFKYEKTLNETLKLLGMVDAFSTTNANFSGLSDIFTHVSFVKQNSYIDVNEDGTEAAAVTTIGIETTSINAYYVHFNKPFIFSIRERTTNTLLFIGTVYNPLTD